MPPELTATNVTEQLGQDLTTKRRLASNSVSAERSIASTPKQPIELVGLAVGYVAAGGIVCRVRVCDLVLIIPLQAARRAMAAVVGFSIYQKNPGRLA